MELILLPWTHRWSVSWYCTWSLSWHSQGKQDVKWDLAQGIPREQSRFYAYFIYTYATTVPLDPASASSREKGVKYIWISQILILCLKDNVQFVWILLVQRCTPLCWCQWCGAKLSKIVSSAKDRLFHPLYMTEYQRGTLTLGILELSLNDMSISKWVFVMMMSSICE